MDNFFFPRKVVQRKPCLCFKSAKTRSIVSLQLQQTIKDYETDTERQLFLAKQKRSIIVELDPPKQLNFEKFLHAAEELKSAGIDALTLADNSQSETEARALSKYCCSSVAK